MELDRKRNSVHGSLVSVVNVTRRSLMSVNEQKSREFEELIMTGTRNR